jgi:TonB family protein
MRLPGLSWSVVLVTCAILADDVRAGQALPRPALQQPTNPRQIQAREGDLIVVEGADRVLVMRRRTGELRAIYNAEQSWLVLLVDHPAVPGGMPDGGVDVSYTYSGLVGAWPLGARWQGEVAIEEYTVLGDVGAAGTGLQTPAGLVQLLAPGMEAFGDPRGVTLTFRGSGRGGGGGLPFDAVEERQVAVAIRNAEMRARIGEGVPAATVSLEGGVVASPPAGRTPPVRVGSVIKQPRKLVDVAPVLPEAARAAGISGAVILEVVVGVTGAVSDVKVLRSLPMLDDAAIEAVSQWRYEPVLLNGQPVPVVITVAVRFPS